MAGAASNLFHTESPDSEAMERHSRALCDLAEQAGASDDVLCASFANSNGRTAAVRTRPVADLNAKEVLLLDPLAAHGPACIITITENANRNGT